MTSMTHFSVHCQRDISPETALALGQMLVATMNYWSEYQRQEELAPMLVKEIKTLKRDALRRQFPKPTAEA